MNRNRWMTIPVALLVAAVAMTVAQTLAADALNPAEQESEWIALLQSPDSPKADKAITCKRLAVFGSKDAVPALAALLPDQELASWARIALEAIPGPEADLALRDAMGVVQGRLLIGVINSIAVRRDPAAVEELTKRLKDPDADVASAAAVALGRIGNAQATETLSKSLAGAPVAVRSAVAEGCILCAEKLLSDGKSSEAAKLYEQVRGSDVPKQRILEATRGSILAQKSDGIPLLIEQLRSADKVFFRLGLSTAREISAEGVSEALVAELGRTTPERQALILVALADRNDPAVIPSVLEASKSGSIKARIAAVGMLRRVGNASCIPVLLEVALDADADLSQAAIIAIEGLPGADVDSDLAARLSQAKGATRLLLIELVGQRRIAAAVPSLLKAADDPDSQIRSAALLALGSTIEPNFLPFLISRVVTPRNAEDTASATKALHTACIRMPDREDCASKLSASMSRASVSTQCTLLETLGAMGGTKALMTVGAAARAKDPQLQDTATRLLGEWMTVDAAPVLLGLAKSLPPSKYQVRALRGHIRLVRQFVIPDPQRAQMCRDALEVAKRDDEKKLVLEVMERYPSIDMLRLAVELAKNPSLKNDAARVSMVIAQKISGKSGDVQKLLTQLGQGPMKIEIIKAEYGAGTSLKDVTKVLQQHTRDFPLIVLPSSSYNSAFGGDPASGVVKQLKIQYRINGKSGEITLHENATIMLTVPK